LLDATSNGDRLFSVTDERFHEIVDAELAAFPKQFSDLLENVEILIEDHNEDSNILALYRGIPLTKRTPQNYFGVMPDTITFYKSTISRHCNTEQDVIVAVHHVLRHEVAHYFGISDDRLRELGQY
jgi:predicted Zn-dependent protease with MMP-like domain